MTDTDPNSLVPTDDTAPAKLWPDLQRDADAAGEYFRARHAPNTQRAYDQAWRAYDNWCLARRIPRLPEDLDELPAQVAMFISAEAKRGLKVATLAQRVAGVSDKLAERHQVTLDTRHKALTGVMAGVRRAHPDRAKPQSAEPLKAPALIQVLDKMRGSKLVDLRDRAILLLGFASACRRSELAALEVEDVERHEQGIVLQLREAKGDRKREGEAVAVSYGDTLCPILALDDWLQAAAIIEGPIFRGIDRWGGVSPTAMAPESIGRLVKARAKAAGMDVSRISGHSLRAGLMVSARELGADLLDLAEHARHKDLKTTRGYTKGADRFKGVAGKDVFGDSCGTVCKVKNQMEQPQ